MPRPKRINLPDCLYHVINRTNSGDMAFRDSRDYGKFLFYLNKYVKLFDFRIHAFCLMPDHFHLLMETGEHAALSEFMRRLLTAYTVFFNRRHKRHGHLFQGRFKSIVVDKSTYLLALSRYIHLNPLKARLCKKPEDYAYSSLRYFINGGEPPYLFSEEILGWFKGRRDKYYEFINDGLTEDVKPLVMKQRYVAGDKFIQRFEKRLLYMNKEGCRAQRAAKKREGKINEESERTADLLAQSVAAHFGVLPQMIRSGRSLRGPIGKARTVLIGLFREKLTWSHNQIAAYLGLEEKSGISYHIGRLNKDKKLLEAFRELIK
ncbi:transposase [Candidatus Sumerlaeota bacterium]|nr:transposase [Candidatus Sumerlaeota bacterium]